MTPALARPLGITESLMIKSFELRHFRCFKFLEVRDCSRINIIVGDNGAGKTSLLEGIFLALASSTEVALRYRQQRGLEGSFGGQIRKIEEAMWRDLFFKQDWSQTLSISLNGNGPESRTVRAYRSSPSVSLPIEDSPSLPFDTNRSGEQRAGAVNFVWTDAAGREFVAKPSVTKRGIEFPGTEEDVPDFFYFSSSINSNSTEVAQRFSDLRRAGGIGLFESVFKEAFPWVSDIQVEVVAGAPILYGTDDQRGVRLPLAYMSGAMNRMCAILLAVAARSDSVVLVDEVENGLFYKNHAPIWRAILSFAREYNTQVFMSTHSREWLSALLEAEADSLTDVTLWRIERNGLEQPTVFRFEGDVLKDGLEYGAEVRGGKET
ncbi:MAG: AAA family ATPase [Pseudorhodoplanes sp.]|nr:AAA family ATPase [Pseudorhodoplanes sp.]